MNDSDRFTRFLAKAAADYNAPPETPREVLWAAVETSLEEAEARPVASERASTTDTLDYHEPPETPREEMWHRIEAAWALRASVPSGAREAGLGVLATPDTSDPKRERRSVALWITSLAVAASLVMGVLLGRGSLVRPGDAPQVASLPIAADASAPSPNRVGGLLDETSPADLNPGEIERLETSAQVAFDPGPDEAATLRPEVLGAPADEVPSLTRSLSERRQTASQVATSDHMGRAATLLTAFRTDDASPDGQAELARWARELLGDTRLLLDMDVSRTPQERGLLEDLELLLAQMARLGPGAADFERELIEEGIERQGTLGRLRSVGLRAGT